MTFWNSTAFTGVARSGVVEAYVCEEAHALASRFPEVRRSTVAIESGAPGCEMHVRVALVVGDEVVQVAVSGQTGASAERICELAGRAFDHAVTSLTARRSLRGLRNCPDDDDEHPQARAS